MPTRPRKFVQVKCDSFSHQPRQRELQLWRVNLTALSQHANLFFVAVGPEIHVYEPTYPLQTLTQDPRLVLDPPPLRAGTPGYIDRQRPHSINHLVTADFGEDEILIAACDDGDVYSYYVNSILDVLRYSEFSRPNPFFHENLPNSAWGISVHCSSRLIAFSCNSHEIFVFAFALAQSEDERLMSASEAQPSVAFEMSEDDNFSAHLSDDGSDTHILRFGNWHLHPLPAEFRDRKRNLLVILHGHTTNIPDIAFCNTGDDPEGRFLMSIDIRGNTVIWDVAEADIVRHRRHDANPWNGGWALQWLDKRSFFHSDAKSALLTTARYGKLRKPEETYIVDMTLTRDTLPKSRPWTMEPDQRGAMEVEAGPDASFLLDFVADIVDSDEDDEISPSPMTRRDETRRASRRVMKEPALLAHSGIKDHTGLSTFMWSQGWPLSSQVYKRPDTFCGEKCSIPPHAPVLRINAQQITLHQISLMEYSTEGQPFLVFDDPLEQEVPPEYEDGWHQFDRMNMTLQIPELGLVIAGSGKGRVAVFSLHNVHPNPFRELCPHPYLTMRLDAILPRAADEAAGKRPRVPLVGVAASPVQGSGRSDASAEAATSMDANRRWRVMLTYYDHTVLSYELWREREVTRDGQRMGVSVSRDDVPFV